jgi:predicted TIM-barrel fold metal-dependent hydrolase
MSVVKRKKIFDNHTHIGPVPGYAYYGLPKTVKPTTDYQTTTDYLKGMDNHGVDRALIMSNYGYPDSVYAQPARGRERPVDRPHARADLGIGDT